MRKRGNNMVCPNCGKELSDDSLFCNSCGAKVTLPPQNPAEEVQNVASPPLPKPSMRKRNFLIILAMVVCLIVVVLPIFILCPIFVNPLPYGIHWGDSYAIVSSKDKSALPVLTVQNSNMSASIFYPSLGFPEGTFNAVLTYDFGLDDSLADVSCIITIPDESEHYADDVFKSFVDYYTKVCKRKPKEEKSLLYTWTTSSTIINLTYYSEHLFYLTFDQVQ